MQGAAQHGAGQILAGRRALVTGSTSGIGLAVVRELAKAGARVILNGSRNVESVINLMQDVQSATPVPLDYVQADLSSPEKAGALVEEAARKMGGLDILINNAGVQHVAPIAEFPPEKWTLILNLNLSAAFFAMRAAIPYLKKAGKQGRIINMASAHALVASPFKAAYVAAKHGLLGLTKTAALELAEEGVTVNALCPGYVRTPLVENQLADTARARKMREEDVIRDVILAAQPSKQFVEVEALGAYCVFLCSPAGQGITGAALPVDGGWTAR
jgi:3-hydroxybutyrate dehydrogenase